MVKLARALASFTSDGIAQQLFVDDILKVNVQELMKAKGKYEQ
ncbi:hypothetical protein MKY41_03250 [Sporosarcina sp. FSL W7-1349]